jgi:hypothetical protein
MDASAVFGLPVLTPQVRIYAPTDLVLSAAAVDPSAYIFDV